MKRLGKKTLGEKLTDFYNETYNEDASNFLFSIGSFKVWNPFKKCKRDFRSLLIWFPLFCLAAIVYGILISVFKW